MANNQVRKWHLSRSDGRASKSKDVCDVATVQWDAGDAVSRIEIDLASPSTGATYADGVGEVATRLFGIDKLETVGTDQLDPYLRGDDLIVSYPASDKRPVGVELYWRWSEFQIASDESENEGVVAPLSTLELIYSLETNLLDSQPNPKVTSILLNSSRTFYCLDDTQQLVEVAGDSPPQTHACVFRSPDSERALLLAVMPTDLKSTNSVILEDGRFQLDWELNSEFLEKGVIRRLRVFAAFDDNKSNHNLIAAANQFLSSEIPLTA